MGNDSSSLAAFVNSRNESWVSQLSPDPETAKNAPNTSSRQVKSGHYVLVRPKPLPNPELVTFSPSMASELGISPNDTKDARFTRFFSGDWKVYPDFKSWATPYALAIYGTPMVRQCPFGTGNGYGDGRAISVAEIVNPKTNKRWECQLKGSGPTPFCRGADGRAVLRSSVREFLVSEAMHNLGVSTTRALSLVNSSEVVMRPWYSDAKDRPTLTFDDPRIAHIPPEMRRVIMQQFQEKLKEPDKMVRNSAAISTRVAPSFLRVGHVDHFSRRVTNQTGVNPSTAKKELEEIVEHLWFREYAGTDNLDSKTPLPERTVAMMREASHRFAKLMADWVRVGYCQGNFNSDNCLAGGRTMDYGPFGFVEKFEHYWNMWTGGGRHFGFMNQPVAGEKNFGVLLEAVLPLLDGHHRTQALEIKQQHTAVTKAAMDDMWQRKLGFLTWDTDKEDLASRALALLEKSSGDYTLFWRQLGYLAKSLTPDAKQNALSTHMGAVFYEPLTEELKTAWNNWFTAWQANLGQDGSQAAAVMLATSPKYVPREWMLVEAYTQAQQGEYAAVKQLQEVFDNPFEELPQFEALYYRRAPQDTYQGVGKGGTAFMT